MSRFASLALDTETPRRMTIRHPATGEPLVDAAGVSAFLDLLSLTSAPAQKSRNRIQQRRIDSRARRVTVDEAEAEAMQVLAACTVGWHLVGLDGAPIDVPCSPDAAVELYTTPGLRFIADQATIFADNAGNFLPASSTT
jgi:hypothetical protein